MESGRTATCPIPAGIACSSAKHFAVESGAPKLAADPT